MSYADSYDAADGVAIVGMSGRFPGALTPAELWRILTEGKDAITRFAPGELEPSSPEETAMLARQEYVRARGVLSGVEEFDNGFFGLNPREAEVMDPQQRLFLQAAWEALEDAGCDPQTFAGLIGVFAGSSNNTYYQQNVQSRPDMIAAAGEYATMMGNEKDFLATRVAYKLDLRGPALSIQNACATSLVATSVAVQSLLNYQCDMALAGGVSIMLPQRRGYLWQEGSIMSPDGRCRAFDGKAAGTVPGNGVGIVVLRRLRDALADGDRIYAVIKGVALNNDGSSKVSFMAPNADGQAQVIAMAQAQACIDPDTISYVEAHGTATLIGDPIEVSGLTQAFRAGGAARNGYCALGSIKTNIGHLDAAAGVAGLIKAALSLHHKQLPPSLHFESPNPQLQLEQTPFYVNDRLREWPAGATPRRAGVSSFGVGGTNAHLVLEEAPVQTSSTSRARQLLLLSARSAEGAERSVARLREHLQADPGHSLADVAFTLTKRRKFEHRRAFVCRDSQHAIDVLNGADPKAVVALAARGPAPSVAFLFPGQGAQHVNMGRALYESEALFRREIDQGSEVLRPLLGLDLRAILYPGNETALAAARAQIIETSITQPALFLIEYALAQLWMSWGIRPAAMIGHSLGEYVAATLAGVFTRDDALTLVAQRARLMQELPPGSMLAVRAAAEAIAPFLKEGVSIAAVNAPKLTVVSGEGEVVTAMQAELETQGIASRPLATSHAFHSAMMQPAVAKFAAVVAATPRAEPRQTWISSLTGDVIAMEQATDPSYWASQLRQPVQFAKGIGKLNASHPLLLEVGPGQTLVNFAKQSRDYDAEQAALTSLNPAQDHTLDLDCMLGALGHMWAAGVPIDWASYYERETRCGVSVPTYPFEQHRRWIEPARPASSRLHPQTSQLSANQNIIVEEVMPESNVAAPQEQIDDSLLPQLQSLFSELSGLEPDSLKADVGFLELGLDSLFLAQASVALEKKFGVKIGFRELLDEYSTLQLLAKRLRPHVSVAPVARPVQAPSHVDVVQRAVALQPAATSAAVFGSLSAGNLEEVLKMQLQLMARQLEMLSGGSTLATVASAPLPRTEPSAQLRTTAAAQPAQRQEDMPASAAPVTAMGPYRPLVKGNHATLSAEQQSRVKELIEKYNDRTRASKQYTEMHRPHLADPRTVAGFRQIWKEAVYPIVVNRSSGARLWDIDGNEYVDLTNGFGINLFGHNPSFINEAIQAQLAAGLEIGPQTPLAGEVARLIAEMVGMERVVFCNTGSEAVTAALRVARTVTNREKIAVFAGSYHGIFDEVLVRPAVGGTGARALPVAPGLAGNVGQNVLILEYDNPESLRIIKEKGSELAAVLVEPVQSRRPELQPREFLRQLREVTAETGSALIFDEMVTGFRSHSGGVQALFGIRADIATYGKVVGGGMPLGVVAGSAKFMDALDGGPWRYGDESSPEVGMTIFAGTFVRHPLALAAARATLLRLKQEGPELQRRLNLRTTAFVNAMNDFARSVRAPMQVVHFASWFCFNWQGTVPMASLFFIYIRLKGVHLWEGRPSFLTLAHSDADLEFALSAFKATVLEMQSAGFLPGGASVDPPLANARRGRDASGNEAWFVPDPERPGKYLQVAAETGS